MEVIRKNKFGASKFWGTKKQILFEVVTIQIPIVLINFCMMLNIVGNGSSSPPFWRANEQVLLEVEAKELPTVLIKFNPTLKIFHMKLNIVGNQERSPV